MGAQQIVLGMVAALMLLAGGGCAIPAKYEWNDLPRYQPGQPAQVRMTSQAGMYVVAAQPRHKKRSQAVEATETHLASGTRLGFITDERGHLIAYTQHQQFDLGTPSSRLKYVQWTTRQCVEPAEVLFTWGDVAEAAGQVGAVYVGDVIDKALDDATRPRHLSKPAREQREQEREQDREQLFGGCR